MGQLLAITIILIGGTLSARIILNARKPIHDPVDEGSYGDWPHCPPVCGCRGGADTGLPFQHRGVGNRGRLNHRGGC